MRKKVMKEWFLDVPWGKMAMASWGDSGNPPVLLVHGYVDTLATFVPLVNLLPDTYYYVAFDLPGHGRSDPAPGPPVSYVHFAEFIRLIVEHLQWNTFIGIAHSMGYFMSSTYNAAFPGRMSKLVNLDGSTFISWHLVFDHPDIWFQRCYSSYYENYLNPELVTYTYDDAIALIMRTRDLTADQAAGLATRCLEPMGDGMYKCVANTTESESSSILTKPNAHS